MFVASFPSCCPAAVTKASGLLLRNYYRLSIAGPLKCCSFLSIDTILFHRKKFTGVSGRPTDCIDVPCRLVNFLLLFRIWPQYQMFPLAISVNFVIFFRTFCVFKQAIKCFQLEEFPSQGPWCCESVVRLKFFLCRIHHLLEEAQHTPLERMAWTSHASWRKMPPSALPLLHLPAVLLPPNPKSLAL